MADVTASTGKYLYIVNAVISRLLMHRPTVTRRRPFGGGPAHSHWKKDPPHPKSFRKGRGRHTTLGTSVEQIIGSNGRNSKDNGPGKYLAALSEPTVIALVRMLERLPKSKRREAARAITDLITAILGHQ
jgi:hypothetical protein